MALPRLTHQRVTPAVGQFIEGEVVSGIKRFGLLLITLPIIGAVISFTYATLVDRGVFVEWVSLGASPKGKVIKVIWADHLLLDSGDLYRIEYDSINPGDVRWIKSKKSPSYFDAESSSSSDTWCIDSFNLPALHRFSDSKIVCQPWGDGVLLTITAIDNVGNVYSWKKGSGMADGINVFLSPFIGAMLGALAMIPFLLILLAVDKAKPIEKHG